jgi:hypothetical protein
MLNLWKHTNQFEPGTTVRADHANFKLNGIEASFDQIAEYMDKRVVNLPASFTGNAYIPNKTLNNAIVWFNTSGDMDVYSMATFEQKVTDTTSNAASALDSRIKAATSEANARQSELNAAASAEVAQGAAVTVAGAAFFAGLWNASTGNFPAPPGSGGSSMWQATTDGTGATAAIKAGDLIVWDIIAGTYRHFAGAARVIALSGLLTSEISRVEAKANAALALASAGL